MKKFLLLIGLILYLFFIPGVSAQVSVLVVYHSETGNTEKMARAVTEGAQSVDGIEVVLKSVEHTGTKDLLRADGIIVGSPVYNANISPEMQQFITSWPFENQPLNNKIGAAFVTAGGMSAGEEIVQMNILQSMLIFGMIIAGGPDWTQPFGASAVTGEHPFEAGSPEQIDTLFLQKGRALGERVARITLQMHGSGNRSD